MHCVATLGPLAQLLAMGSWSVDVTTVLAREHRIGKQSPLRPPKALLKQYFIVLREASSQATWAAAMSRVPNRSRASSVRAPVPAEFMLQALAATRHARSVRRAVSDEFLMSVASFLEHSSLPGAGLLQRPIGTGTGTPVAGRAGQDGQPQPKQKFRGMTPTNLVSARLRLDVCAMLAQRVISKAEPCFRYLCYDASPQRGGREVMCTRENRAGQCGHCQPCGH